jgi:DNA-binding LacI/PurR family transcriptional regulator
MNITVKDVAKAAGVSRTTVSNVFNGRAKCTEETRQAVFAAAKRLGYRPNLAAKSLVTNQSHLIGLLLPSYVDNSTLTHSPFYNIILDGIFSTVRAEAYYDLMVFCIPPNGTLTEVSEWISTRNVDGIIAIGEYEASFLKEMDAKRLPMVFIDNYQTGFTNFSYMNSDDGLGGYIAAKRLLDKGFTRIALCTATLKSPVYYKRYEGYRQALQEAGYEEMIFERDEAIPFEAGQALGERVAQQEIDAVFCTEDLVAIGIMKTLLNKGVQVGQEFGIVGFDNLMTGMYVHPGLTTIDQAILEKGQIAARTLLDILKKDALRCTKLILPVRFVERESA